ncbi:peptidylprolyl isomerase [Luteimonas vadosa]|uniref:Chaperone SurA n=1 Tax=Luteimonas vadosa TaxID=1165507 RepID=A0ABP9EA01_9GAMM
MKKLPFFASALVLAPLLAACLLLAPNAQAQSVEPLDGIAAVVDEDVILRSELDRAVRNILTQYAGRPGQLPPRDVLERQVLERLILVRLQTARAQATGVSVSDAEVDAAIANIASQNNSTPEQLRQQLVRDGLSYPEFRNSLRDELMIQRLRQRFAQSRISVSDAEVDAALATQGNAMQYRLAHILVALPEGATAEQIATGEQKIEGVKGLLERGEMDFSAAAVRYSDSQNALEGGDLGWRTIDEIPAAFAGSIRGMQPGQIIGPLRGPSGFQLLQLVETRQGAQATSGGGMVTQYQARHILIRAEDGAEDGQAKAKIDTLRARIAGGADFVEVARANSEDTRTKSAGGDLGWFNADDFGPLFGAQVTALEDGQVSAPFRTDAGWHVVQRIGSRQVDATDENRRAMVRETIGQRKLEDDWNRFLREMRGEAYVDIRTGANADDATSGG